MKLIINKRKLVFAFFLIIIIPILVILWGISERKSKVEMELSTKEIEFNVESEVSLKSKINLIGSLRVGLLCIAGFDEIELESGLDLMEKRKNIRERITIRPLEENLSSVLLVGNSVYIPYIKISTGSEVRISVSDMLSNRVNLDITDEDFSNIIELTGAEYQLFTERCEIFDKNENLLITSQYVPQQEFRIRPLLINKSMFINGSRKILLYMDLPLERDENASDLILDKIKIAKIIFTRRFFSEDKYISSLNSGVIRFPEFNGNKKPLYLRDGDFIQLSHLQDFFIEKIELNSNQNTLDILCSGLPETLKIGPTSKLLESKFPIYFEWWKYNNKLTFILGIFSWVVIAIINLFRLHKEIIGKKK